MTEAPGQVRDADPRDSEPLAVIYNGAIRSGCSTMHTEPVSTDYFERLLEQLSSGEALLVCEAGPVAVGWGIVKRYSERPGYAYACETSVYVAQEHQQRGYGASLLGAVVDRAQALGYRHLVAKILAVNESSVRFHESFGYEVVGQQRDIGFLNGRWHDVVIMQRVLPDERA